MGNTRENTFEYIFLSIGIDTSPPCLCFLTFADIIIVVICNVVYQYNL